MLKNSKNYRKLQKGFTIIEVMIVLAIAGLILVVVLVAIPQLQRNQRNESRRSVASRITTEINNFAGNNNGNYPTAVVTPSGASTFGAPYETQGFFARYLGCTGTAGTGTGTGVTASTATCSANINDPRTGTPVGSGRDGAAAADDLTTTIVTAGASPGVKAGSIAYGLGLICNGELPVTGANRNFVFMMRLEGGAVLCLDNK